MGRTGDNPRIGCSVKNVLQWDQYVVFYQGFSPVGPAFFLPSGGGDNRKKYCQTGDLRFLSEAAMMREKEKMK